MERSYEIMSGGRSWGTVIVEKTGLYYCINGYFRPDHDSMYRMFLSSGAGEIDLGTCLKTANGYHVHTRIPTKNVQPPISFLVRSHDGESGRFYAVIPGEAFPYIENLPLSRLTTEKGQIGITVPE